MAPDEQGALIVHDAEALDPLNEAPVAEVATPRKRAPKARAQKDREAPAPIPDDADILAAIAENRRLDDEYHAAYDRYMANRKRLVALLHAAGVLGYVGLDRL